MGPLRQISPCSSKGVPLSLMVRGFVILYRAFVTLLLRLLSLGPKVSPDFGLVIMHLPDGFLDARTALLSGGAAAAGIALAVRRTRTQLVPRRIPFLGLSAAFVFAAQMVNFPITGGTSGHLIGGVLSAVLLGPSAAIIVITCVLMVQCLMFADGGLLSLGANVFNMAIVGTCGGHFIFKIAQRLLGGDPVRGTVCAAVFAGWCGTVLASLSCAGQLALSGTIPWGMAFPAMANLHMLIGVGEGLATGLIVLAVLRTRPDLVAGFGAAGVESTATTAGYGLLLSLGLAVFVAPFACPWPDGLESVAEHFGIAHKAGEHLIATPMADYRFPMIASASAATSVAGLVGTVICFGAAYALARVLVPQRGGEKPQ